MRRWWPVTPSNAETALFTSRAASWPNRISKNGNNSVDDPAACNRSSLQRSRAYKLTARADCTCDRRPGRPCHTARTALERPTPVCECPKNDRKPPGSPQEIRQDRRPDACAGKSTSDSTFPTKMSGLRQARQTLQRYRPGAMQGQLERRQTRRDLFDTHSRGTAARACRAPRWRRIWSSPRTSKRSSLHHDVKSLPDGAPVF
jgi:hypothetical protein